MRRGGPVYQTFSDLVQAHRMASCGKSAIILQLGGVGAGLMLMAFAPPAEGDQMLVPLSGPAAARMLPIALERGVSLSGRGPLPGSVVVRGLHAAIGAPLAAIGVLTLAAPAVACGTDEGFDAHR